MQKIAPENSLREIVKKSENISLTDNVDDHVYSKLNSIYCSRVNHYALCLSLHSNAERSVLFACLLSG